MPRGGGTPRSVLRSGPDFTRRGLPPLSLHEKIFGVRATLARNVQQFGRIGRTAPQLTGVSRVAALNILQRGTVGRTARPGVIPQVLQTRGRVRPTSRAFGSSVQRGRGAATSRGKTGGIPGITAPLIPEAGAVPLAGPIATGVAGGATGFGLRELVQTQLGGIGMPHIPGLNIPVGITDITPGVPGHDLQVVDPGNILINNRTGKPVKIVRVGAKLQKKRRPTSRAGAGLRREIDALKQQNMMFMMLAFQHK